MNRHALRSVCSRARPELGQVSGGLRSAIRPFSTTQLQAADEGTPKPTLHQRSRAAASQINSLARERSPVRSAPAAPGQAKPKILDVKSLPRSPLRSKLGPRPGGAGAGAGAGGPPRTGPYTGPPRGPRPSGPRTGGPRPAFQGKRPFRPKTGPPGEGVGGKGRRPAMKRRPREDGEDEAKKEARKRETARLNQMDELEEAFDKELRFGQPAKYTPSLTLESLAPFVPVVPSTIQSKQAAVVHNLSVLGRSDLLGAPNVLQARHLAQDVTGNGIRYYANAADKDTAEAYLQSKKAPVEGDAAQAETTPIISGAEEAIRQVIVDKAVKGQHEAPKFAGDALSVSRSWHLRAETYTTRDVNVFEKKLASLLAARAVKSAPKAAAKGGDKKADKKAEKKAKKKAKA